ncbi:MAG: DNA alkylation repair protein [Alphaproteobacteria bacterium]|jgi:3-methyladenine DNA glycosylase AlkD|nr:DNA alkylation repair protein [Alphaproteobacteria bacterium]HJP23281.1 DNA alkylation repair protein [Alphaproteobacteria bacterium]
MQLEDVLARMKVLSDPASLAGMARFGIRAENAFGLRIPQIRALAKEIGSDHALATALWHSAIHDARLLAPMIEEAKAVTPAQMDAWAGDFNSWDVCDQCCANLFWRLDAAWEKAVAWTDSEPEYLKRAGFALMASLAWKHKQAPNESFLELLPVIEAKSDDNRNFVKKAVNWALRQIGKRNRALNEAAVACAERIAERGTPAARWIARDALRELTAAKTLARLKY